MPRSPAVAPAVAKMPGAIYSRLAKRLANHAGPIYPLHVGDTWMEPLEAARMEALRTEALPGLHRYTRPQGLDPLVDALLEKCRDRNGLPVERRGISVTAGATGGLAATIGALVSPGEEVLILAPFWPLIRGHVQSFRGVPVEVPFFDRVQSIDQAIAAVEERRTERTVALYVSTPSNPTGRVLPAAWLQALAEWARRHDLWLISDETYEDYVYQGTHASIGAFAPERTVTAFSFSKAYGMAGNRVGYLAGPGDVLDQIRKISTHTFFCAPRSGQQAALVALQQGGDWIANAHRAYAEAGRDAAEVLGVPAAEGSTFLFLDIAERLDERGVFGFLEDIVEDGLLLAPGPSFGKDYPTSVRLCFTSAPPDQVAVAVRRLAERLR